MGDTVIFRLIRARAVVVSDENHNQRGFDGLVANAWSFGSVHAGVSGALMRDTKRT